MCVNNRRVASHPTVGTCSAATRYHARCLRARDGSVTHLTHVAASTLTRVGFLSLSLVGLTAGCDREERTRAEARTFLALYEVTDHRAPIAERERKLAQIEQLTLTDPAIAGTRDECVGAHRALIRGERENEQAAAQLDRALSAQPDGGPLDPQQAEHIRAGIVQAERSVGDARARFERCEEQARSLSLRFGAR